LTLQDWVVAGAGPSSDPVRIRPGSQGWKERLTIL